MVGLEVVTGSRDETRAVGLAVARMLAPRDLVSLTGDLGAGKTSFVQGAARGLGVEEPVLSPTFILAREYRGDLPVLHLDVYRLERLQEVLDLGFEEILDRRGVVFIEWGDAIEAILPESYLEVRITIPEGSEEEDGARTLALAGRGRAWEARWERLTDLLGPWQAARREGTR